ncbi:hypothetical protein [Streptomyces curacoi]|uniref:Uncharacterized protein n=1 Tax=Streptomyces curacoi TaxID=146536 RepID=A0A117P886_9ACTN|nr:hypothetical protein [Streptomyces curacoi]KUM74874.1 hypothetical protein AQI70_18845 [Streptomyces curacoi]
MSASESKAPSEVRPRPYAPVAGVSVRDLLAANAAATLISTPPREPEAGQQRAEPAERHREAA